jgi:hypothetical protein
MGWEEMSMVILEELIRMLVVEMLLAVGVAAQGFL